MSSQDAPPPVAVGQVAWGDLRRQEPLSRVWGYDRGQPVDRYYIEDFLRRHADSIQGRCLEVLNADYTIHFGQDRISHSDVVDIDTGNAKANIHGDLLDPGTLAPAHYDCFILTQTLQMIYDCGKVIGNAYAALKPGGTMLVTVPFLCRYSPHPEEYWRFTDASLRRLVVDNTEGAEAEFEVHGNLVASMAFLTGMSTQELTRAELDHRDSRFPIVIAAAIRKR